MKRLLLLTPLLLGACVAAPPPDGTPSAAAPPPHLDAEATEVRATTTEIPEWYVNPPTDGRALYAAGTADSGDLEFAIDKAVLSAKRSLADRVNGSVSSRQNEYLEETGGNAQPAVMSNRTTTNRITDVVLNGYTVIQTKLVPSDNQYRAFVLLRYPIANVSAAPTPLVEHESLQETKLKAAKAFEDLQKDIDATTARNDVGKDAAPPPSP